MVRFLTAGESHGSALVAILEGIPAGLSIDFDALTADLRRRQLGYGRGRRMTIERDRAEILSGVRAGETIGGPIALLIANKDWENWQQTMSVAARAPGGIPDQQRSVLSKPRPGHADLAGALKYDRDDLRDILERASARETAARVAAGAIARQFLAHFGIEVLSHVVSIGTVGIPSVPAVPVERIRQIPPDSRLRCADPGVEDKMIAEIDRAREAGDTVGGSFEVVVTNVPIGLGSYVQWDRRLDGRLGQAVMSIPAIKAVGIGRGPDAAALSGSQMHDEILPIDDASGSRSSAVAIYRPTNNAGGLEGGVTNGEEVRVTGYMKPISTLMKPLRSVDLTSMTQAPASVERSDICAVTAAGVVGEAVVALVVADAFLEKFGGDSIGEVERHYEASRAQQHERLQKRS